MRQRRREIDKLGEAVKSIPPRRLRGGLVKEERINLRVTASEKADMQRVAKACGLTLTEYLIRLHTLISAHLQAHGLLQER